MKDIYLTDLINVSFLQRFQDSFSNLTGLAALITDAKGKPVTKGSNFTRYCNELTRKSKVGSARCEQCDRIGAQCTLESGRAEAYMCHSGLMDFSAPIMLENTMIGCVIGGQVLTEKPNKSFIRSIANQIGVNPEEYWQALQEVRIVNEEIVKKDAEFLFDMAGVLSDVAYERYKALETSKEMERVAHMKTDFLANMSHEIRTPMNAVIGMAELALREELPNAARDYIAQIKSSGNALLCIINDILDFSKIESGKMDIRPDDYEILSTIHDISNMLMTRLRDKDIELLVSINPNIPVLLWGDCLRVKQVLINIANNAVKFTQQGYVKIMTDYEVIDEENIRLKFAVQDTGIGIKKEDIGKLFQSFEQLDSKRNRNIEGTGLGLAISKRLLDLMGGEISVESEYGKGSEFTFWIPQKVSDWASCVEVNYPQRRMTIGYFGKKCIARQFYQDMKVLGIDSACLISLENFDDLCLRYEEEMGKKRISFFTEEQIYEEELEGFTDKYPNIDFVVLSSFFSSVKSVKENVHFVKKPMSTSTIALVLNGDQEQLRKESVSLEFDFIAPEAKILIVDDNLVNLSVAEGLLKPLEMQITTANSGIKALKYLDNEKFDLVFMDHMMPEVDGVETTRIIRRLHPELADMPIIALTANAVGDAKKMFLSEGMDDFVPKPIEARELVSKVRQWLPKEKIMREQLEIEEKPIEEEELLVIGDLDVSAALNLIGSMDIYRVILKMFYDSITAKAEVIRQSELKEDISLYTIEVHALKSSARQIGAIALSELAAYLEQAGKDENIELIHQETETLVQKYLSYVEVIKPFVKEEQTNQKKKSFDLEEIQCLFTQMHVALENLDMDVMEDVMNELEQYEYEGESAEYCHRLKETLMQMDTFQCEDILVEWEQKYEKNNRSYL